MDGAIIVLCIFLLYREVKRKIEAHKLSKKDKTTKDDGNVREELANLRNSLEEAMKHVKNPSINNQDAKENFTSEEKLYTQLVTPKVMRKG